LEGSTRSSDYLTALNGATIGGGTNPNPMQLTAKFTLNAPVTNINGIRLIGSEGGTASGGFLGVLELSVLGNNPQSALVVRPSVAAGQLTLQFESQSGATYLVQYKNQLADANWQVLSTISGDGTRKQVNDPANQKQRFYRIMTQ
jgi:hypothetical protein